MRLKPLEIWDDSSCIISIERAGAILYVVCSCKDNDG